MNSSTTLLPAVGRTFLALIFVLAGIAKLGTVSATAAHMAASGIPHAHVLVWGAIALELGGGILLIVGFLTRLLGAVFFFYLLALALIFHAYWTLTGAAAHAQHAAFFEHLAMMGGMLYVAAFGGGAYSVDSMIWHRQPHPHPQPAE